MVSDPIAAAISEAVERAVAAQLEKIIDTIKGIEFPKPEAPAPDRIVRIGEAAKMLGIHRATLRRYEKDGKLPKKRQIGDGASGYLLSDLMKLLKPEGVEVPAPKKRGRS